MYNVENSAISRNSIMINILIFTAFYQPIVNRDLPYEMELRGVQFSRYTFRFYDPPFFIEPEYINNLPVYFKNHISISSSFSFDSIGDFYFSPFVKYNAERFIVAVEPVFKIGNTGWPEQKWQNFLCGAYSRAYIYWHRKPFSILYGRNRLSLNSGVVIDQIDPAIDLIYLDYRKKTLLFSYFFSQVSPYKDDTLFLNRYLVGHSIEFTKGGLNLSFTEVCLFFNYGNSPDFYYLNPLVFYYEKGFDTGLHGETNVFWIPAVKYKFGKNLINFELDVDDFQYQITTYAPPKIAWRIGYHTIDFLTPRSYLSLEYFGSTRWVFTHGTYILNWQNRKETMGNLNDCDEDVIRLYFLKHLTLYDLGFDASFKWNGAGSVNERDIYWGNGPYPRDYFLTGTVEKRINFSPIVQSNLKNYFAYLSPSISYAWNHQHILHNNKWLYGLSIKFFAGR